MINASNILTIAWNNLPGELWLMIIDHGSLKEFAAVSLVSKRLHKLVEPVLYSSFSWVPEESQVIPSVSDLGGLTISQCTKSRRKHLSRGIDPFGPPPFLLLRTLLNRPDFAPYVKHIKILIVDHGSGMFRDRYEAREGGLSSNEIFECEAYMKKIISLRTRRKWIRGMQMGCLDTAIALLVTMLPKLASADLRLRGNVEGHIMFEALLLSTTHSNPTLKSLIFSLDSGPFGEVIHNYHERDKHNIHTETPSIFNLPGIENLCINDLRPNPSTWDFYMSSMTALKRLSLPYSDLNETLLGSILLATPNLEHLDCVLVFDQTEEEQCDGEVLNTALSRLAGTLKSLTLKINILQRSMFEPWKITKPLGSMKHFKRLRYSIYFEILTIWKEESPLTGTRYLNIPMAALITEDTKEDFASMDEILPPNLTSLAPEWREPELPTPNLYYQVQDMINHYFENRSWPLPVMPRKFYYPVR